MKKHNFAIRLLLRVGLVRIHTGYGLVSEAEKKKDTVIWPFYIAPRHNWDWRLVRYHWRTRNRVYVFRNPAGFVKWQEGRILPRRWGFGILCLIEFGDRG